MKALGVRYIASIGLGMVWGLTYSAVFSSLPTIQRLELDIQDSLIRLHKPKPIPKEILAIKINPSDLSGYDLHNLYKLNIYYATLVKSLFENGARVVVVNLPEQMKQYIDTDTNTRLERPLRKLIHQYSNRIVLVTRPNNLPSGASALNIYNNLLPFDDESASRSIAPEQIISYFRYAPNSRSLSSPARRANLFDRFNYEDDPNPDLRHRVKSVAILALEKFYTAASDQAGLKNILKSQVLSPVQINFWGSANTFPSISFQLQCSSAQGELNQCGGLFRAQPFQTLRDKLVIVDLPEGKSSENYRVRSPYGEMSVAEVQANLIASLMTHSFLKTTDPETDAVIVTLGVVLMSLYLANRLSKPSPSFIHLLDIGWFLGLVGGYVGLSLVFFGQGLMLPLSLPILGWLGTGLGFVAYSGVRQSVRQRQKLAERQAVLLQARKLLHRVATDIHDGPLQELKLVMDSIELLNIDHPSLKIDPLLDQLEAIGLALRSQLSSTRTIADKLEITPELQFGLAQGIHQWLQQLIRAGTLTLKVNEQLQLLREPKSDSTWIDAREDVFRFFREAIANVIRHAQPPNGTATQVSIHLSQQGNQYRLAIENNGTSPALTALNQIDNNRTDKKRHTGGYGTKLMATIAAELPNGAWQRIPLEDGGMRVTVTWTIHSI